MRKAARNNLLALGDRSRIYILLVVVFAFMSLLAPKFFTVSNFTAILNAIALNATAAIGFTVVMICGQLDLSIGSVVTFSGALALGLEPLLGFPAAIVVAVLGGALVGLLNGVLVAKAKINSFIVTLGTMTILRGTVYQFSGGNSISVSNDQAFAISDFLGKNFLPLVTPRIVIMLALVIVIELILVRTRAGRNFYMVGGNRTTAWLAGINTDRYLIAAFVLSGAMAAIGGVVSVLVSTSATLNLGDNSLMYVISATIIGGTAMSGAREASCGASSPSWPSRCCTRESSSSASATR